MCKGKTNICSNMVRQSIHLSSWNYIHLTWHVLQKWININDPSCLRESLVSDLIGGSSWTYTDDIVRHNILLFSTWALGKFLSSCVLNDRVAPVSPMFAFQCPPVATLCVRVSTEERASVCVSAIWSSTKGDCLPGRTMELAPTSVATCHGSTGDGSNIRRLCHLPPPPGGRQGQREQWTSLNAASFPILWEPLFPLKDPRKILAPREHYCHQ